MSKYDVYVQRMKAQLDAMNDRLRAIEAQAHEARDEIRAASEEGWHKLVSETERLRHAFTHPLRSFKSPL